MGLLTTLWTLTGTSLATGMRRLKHGPLRPGWSFKYEATVAFMKATNERVVHLDAPTQRAEMESRGTAKLCESLRGLRSAAPAARAGSGAPATGRAC